ncbi:MAG: tetratricopeptide repeat protein [Saprospiraceae bacterium]|nr:tetratricopeptide repeat protein [Saprospiraceae bacterium]
MNLSEVRSTKQAAGSRQLFAGLAALILLFNFCPPLIAQNTIGGQAKIVPEAEVERQSLFVNAEKERMLGKHDKAMELYQKFLYDNPANDAAWYSLARTQYVMKDLVGAQESIAKAAKLQPANEWYAIFQADLFEQTGRTKDAVRIYEDLTRRYPQTAEFYQRLAYLAVLSGDPQGGLKALDKLEKLTGITEETASKKHVIYVGMGDMKKATAELVRLCEAYPAETDYKHRLAEFYETIGNKDAARQTYEQILRINPDDPIAKLAVVAKAKSSSDAAHLASLKPLFADPRVSLDAKIKEILPYFEKLEKTNDQELVTNLLELGSLLEKAHADDPKAWSLSGDLYFYANRIDEALAKYQQCIKLNPSVFSVWENTLDILDRQGKTDELYKTAEQAIDAFPNQPRAYYYYAKASNTKGRYDDALNQLEQAMLMSGNQPALRLDLADQMAVAFIGQKDYQGAKSRLDAVLGKGGMQHAGILEHYGDTLYHLGERDKARDYWQKAQAIAPSQTLEQKIASGKL